jgi:hypothetical protein
MRSPLPACLAAAALVAAPVHAAPSAPAGPDRDTLTSFETGFKEGADLKKQGDDLAAARRWKAAADLLPETTANRDMRAGIYEYIVDAYTSAVATDSSLALVREASTVFDEYIAGYTRAYGTETPPAPKLAAAQQDFADRRARAEASAGPTPTDKPPDTPPEPPPVAPKPPPRPWKPLVITGGVLVGLGGLSVLGGAYGAFQSKQRNDEFDRTCPIENPDAACQELFAKGKDANSFAVGSFVAAAVLLAVGVPLLVVGMKRKKAAANHSFMPVLGPTQVGLGYALRF